MSPSTDPAAQDSRRSRVSFWNLLSLTVALVTLAVFLSVKHPLTDQMPLFGFRANRLFVANTLLSVLLALNAIRFLVFLRQRTVGLILTIATGLSVYFLVEWFLKLQRA